MEAKDNKTLGEVEKNMLIELKDDDINILPAVWNKLYKADIIFQNNLTFPEGLIYED